MCIKATCHNAVRTLWLVVHHNTGRPEHTSHWLCFCVWNVCGEIMPHERVNAIWLEGNLVYLWMQYGSWKYSFYFSCCFSLYHNTDNTTHTHTHTHSTHTRTHTLTPSSDTVCVTQKHYTSHRYHAHRAQSVSRRTQDTTRRKNREQWWYDIWRGEEGRRVVCVVQAILYIQYMIVHMIINRYTSDSWGLSWYFI